MNITEFTTSQTTAIYQIPMEVFPGMTGYAYITGIEDMLVLIDTGSGLGKSNEDLEAGLLEVGTRLVGTGFQLSDITHILITHAHIDHFGGLNFLVQKTQARIGAHELDRRNITNYEERIAVVARRLRDFLTEAGLSAEQVESLLDMYRINKALFHSVPVQFTYEASGMELGPFKMLHVPGHSAGHTVIRLHDVVFSGDHILADISPHQSPERLTLSTGIDHYLRSLDVFEDWAADASLVLGGHKQPVTQVSERVDEIRNLHRERLEKVRSSLCVPKTVKEVSQELFGKVNGYNRLLALEEAGAHVEYLYKRGVVEIANLDEVENSKGATVIRYRV